METEIATNTKGPVRFIAYYDRGIKQPLTHLVLGYGFEEVGISHRELDTMYGRQVNLKSGHMYAGYLALEGDTILVYRGGSMTLSISRDEELDTRLKDELNFLDFKRSVKNLFPLIIANTVPHAMIAQRC